MDSIYIEYAETLSEQQFCLSTRIPALLQQSVCGLSSGALTTALLIQNVKLVVLDSIASLFRVEFENKDFLSRTKSIAQHATLLKHLCNQCGVMVIMLCGAGQLSL